MKDKIIEKFARLASSSPVVAIGIALLELALAGLRRRQQVRSYGGSHYEEHRRRAEGTPWSDELY